MNTLEQRAFPIAEPMILGGSAILSVTQQLTLAAFAALIAANTDLEDKKYSAVSKSDREWLRTEGTPPEGWAIYAGRSLPAPEWRTRYFHWGFVGANVTVDAPDASHEIRAKLMQTPNPLHDVNWQITTVGMGGLLLHALSGMGVPLDSYTQDMRLVRLWPDPEPVDWSSLPILDGAACDKVANAMHDAHRAELRALGRPR